MQATPRRHEASFPSPDFAHASRSRLPLIPVQPLPESVSTFCTSCQFSRLTCPFRVRGATPSYPGSAPRSGRTPVDTTPRKSWSSLKDLQPIRPPFILPLFSRDFDPFLLASTDRFFPAPSTQPPFSVKASGRASFIIAVRIHAINVTARTRSLMRKYPSIFFGPAHDDLSALHVPHLSPLATPAISRTHGKRCRYGCPMK